MSFREFLRKAPDLTGPCAAKLHRPISVHAFLGPTSIFLTLSVGSMSLDRCANAR